MPIIWLALLQRQEKKNSVLPPPQYEEDKKIVVTHVYFFISDSFDFDGWQYLSRWDFINLEHSLFDLEAKHVFNSDFRNFSKKLGYGRQFRIVSLLHRFKGFKETSWDVPW